jgi:hypothetical protein
VQPNSIGSILNYAIVDSTTTDPNPDDDDASVIVSVNLLQPPQLSSSLISSNGAFSITISDPTNPPALTIIQASTNLADWLNIYTSTPPFTFTDPNSTNYSVRFYRALLLP